MRRQTATIEICTDCAHVIANGTGGGPINDDGQEDYETHALNMSDSDITLGTSVEDCRHCGDPDNHGDCEPWFSRSRCECCGTHTGGDRTHATLWWADNDDTDDLPDCEPDCHQGSHSEHCQRYDALYPEHADRPAHGHADAAVVGAPDAPDNGEHRTVKIPRNTRHLSTDDMWRMIQDCEGAREITDACAVTIAAGYQAPSGQGMVFAALVSHFDVKVTDLLDAIAYERRSLWNYGPTADRDRLELDMLMTWAINRWRGEGCAA
jgi:hypothetical protein